MKVVRLSAHVAMLLCVGTAMISFARPVAAKIHKCRGSCESDIGNAKINGGPIVIGSGTGTGLSWFPGKHCKHHCAPPKLLPIQQ